MPIRKIPKNYSNVTGIAAHSKATGQAIPQLQLDSGARIEKIRSDRWIGYPKAKSVLTKLDDLMSYPRIERMPHMLIVGDTNNGKTMLTKRFLKKYPAKDNPEGDGVFAPVLLVQAPPVPDEGRFYNAILELHLLLIDLVNVLIKNSFKLLNY